MLIEPRDFAKLPWNVGVFSEHGGYREHLVRGAPPSL
jgi:hypothetical protein